MAQKLNPFSGRQFLDANGDPYNGAQLFVYEAGTSTKYTLTKDSAGASNHANPIILNTRGEPGDGAGASQVMWQAEGQAVKLVLAPSTDTDPPVAAISTWDDLSGVNDTTVVTSDEWLSGATPSYISATSFSVPGDLSSVYHVGRRLKTTNTGGTVYSTITAVAFTTLTTVTVENDSGSLDAGLSALWYSILSADNTATPGGTHHADVTFADDITFSSQAIINKAVFSKGADIASAAALALGTDGNYFDVTGTTDITSINTFGVGAVVKLHFDGALTLTHHATDLILPNSANIAIKAGDEVELFEYASGDWRLTSYTPATVYTSRKKFYSYTHTSNVAITGTTAAAPTAIGAGVSVDIPTKGIIRLEKLTARLEETTGSGTSNLYLFAMIGSTGYYNAFVDNGGAPTPTRVCMFNPFAIADTQTDTYTDFPCEASPNNYRPLDIESSGITTGTQTLIIGGAIDSGEGIDVEGNLLTTEFVISIEDLSNVSEY